MLIGSILTPLSRRGSRLFTVRLSSSPSFSPFQRLYLIYSPHLPPVSIRSSSKLSQLCSLLGATDCGNSNVRTHSERDGRVFVTFLAVLTAGSRGSCVQHEHPGKSIKQCSIQQRGSKAVLSL